MPIQKRSLTLDGHRTSVSLEPEFWEEFLGCAEARGLSINALASRVDARRLDTADNLSGAIRLYVLADLKRRLAVMRDLQG